MTKLPGNISIKRMQGGREETPVRIELIDQESGCVAAYIHMGLEQFASALLGLSHIKCEFEFNDSGVIGMTAQNKEEKVPVPPYSSRQKGWQKIALAPYEIDDWKARGGDIDNHHCTVRTKDGEFQRVVFFRHVPKVQGNP